MDTINENVQEQFRDTFKMTTEQYAELLHVLLNIPEEKKDDERTL